MKGRPGLGMQAWTGPLIGATLTVLALGVAEISVPTAADAQVRRGRAQQPQRARWAPISLGVRGGWEQESFESGAMFGALARVPVMRDGRLEVVPSFDAIRLRSQTEYQYSVDVAFVPGGVRGGIFVGGGFTWRSSLIAGLAVPDPDGILRKTYTGYNLMLGGKTLFGPAQLEIMLRWSLLNDTAYDPSALTLGLGIPLWGVPRTQPPAR